MNTPSPAPERRRRNPQYTPEAQPIHEQTEESVRRPARRRAQTKRHPRRSLDAFFEGSFLEGSFLERMSAPVRIALIALFAVIFLTCAVGVTRSYLAQQEERRRLEAEAAERAQHPLEFADMIVSYSLAQDLDPALVSAIILCESSYNPLAESRLGARGLMQLMEDTAGWVAHKLDEDDEDYSFDLLYDPETNIRFGTWYLGYLSRRFDADATKIVCAYHAGQGNVDAWLKNPDYSRDGVTLDVIPTQDTATYASRVLRARDVYRKHYFPLPTPVPTESE